MHSLLYNVEENLFANTTYRRYLTDYLQRAVQFAVRINCPSLCFGCGPNRSIPDNMEIAEARKIAEDFLGDLAEYADDNGVCFCLEPIPKCDGTNFINTTQEALDFVKTIKSPGMRLCINMGAVIENREDIKNVLTPENMHYIGHIHISEPGLAPIRQRDIYNDMAQALKDLDYDKFISIEMLEFPDVRLIQGAVNYFDSIFN